ncbi:MAG TPA: hypothetical protein VI911_09630 [Patescibacteria group bacterium]|nr:hypothetical protein [Patescibacteria group bacterium]
MKYITNQECVYLTRNGTKKCEHKGNFERVLSFKEKKVDKKHSTLCGFAVCCAKGCPLYTKEQYKKLFKIKK